MFQNPVHVLFEKRFATILLRFGNDRVWSFVSLEPLTLQTHTHRERASCTNSHWVPNKKSHYWMEFPHACTHSTTLPNSLSLYVTRPFDQHYKTRTYVPVGSSFVVVLVVATPGVVGDVVGLATATPAAVSNAHRRLRMESMVCWSGVHSFMVLLESWSRSIWSFWGVCLGS